MNLLSILFSKTAKSKAKIKSKTYLFYVSFLPNNAQHLQTERYYAASFQDAKKELLNDYPLCTKIKLLEKSEQ